MYKEVAQTALESNAEDFFEHILSCENRIILVNNSEQNIRNSLSNYYACYSMVHFVELQNIYSRLPPLTCKLVL